MLDVFCCFLTEDQRLVKKKSVCSGDNSEVPYTLKREELFARTTSPILRNPNLKISIYGHFVNAKKPIVPDNFINHLVRGAGCFPV